MVELLGQPFVVPDGVSFSESYEEIFVQEIYRFEPTRPRPRIVDCGANIGTSVLYFKRVYPDARITAVEADPEIFRVLQQNLAPHRLSDVVLMNRALSDKAEPVTFHVEGADAGRIHPLDQESDTIRVEGVVLDDLLDEAVDFLKVDVEGAETDAICAARHLDRAASMFVEYHSFVDAPQSLPRLLSALTDVGFRYAIRTQYCSRQPLLEREDHLGMDLQLNVFAFRPERLQ